MKNELSKNATFEQQKSLKLSSVFLAYHCYVFWTWVVSSMKMVFGKLSPWKSQALIIWLYLGDAQILIDWSETFVRVHQFSFNNTTIIDQTCVFVQTPDCFSSFIRRLDVC